MQQSFEVGTPALQDQTITFLAIGDRLTTDAPFDISATASSGLAVSFTIISGPASISGNTISLDGVTGTVVVQADQAGNGTYNPAPSVQQSFEVGTPALLDQTITFPAIADRLTTDAPFDISATASSGLAMSFSIVSGPASISGNTITLDGVTGTIIVEASQGGNGTYNPAPSVQQSFEVGTPALLDQTITFPAIGDRLTTDAPFDISATASSDLAVSFSIISGPVSINENTITLDGITGTVVVQADQAGNGTYNAAPSVQQSFEVSASPNNALIDLELNMTAESTVLNIWNVNTFTLSASNNGAITATAIKIDFPVPDGFAYIEGIAAQGDYNGWLQEWNIASLEAGEVATMTLELFVLQNTEAVAVYSQVVAVGEDDFDSTPNNNEGPIPLEDDEAAVVLSPPGSSFGESNEASQLQIDYCGGEIPEDSGHIDYFNQLKIYEQTIEEAALRMQNLNQNSTASEPKIIVYPNPVSEQEELNIMVAWPVVEPLYVQVLDIHGRVLKRFKHQLKQHSDSLSLSLTDFPVGIYILNFVGENQHYSKRIIKQ